MSTMTFKLNNGSLTWVNKPRNKEIRKINNVSDNNAYIFDFKKTKEYIKNMEFLKNKSLMIAPTGLIVATATGGTGVFWGTFMKYIFPYMMDIAKVYCAIQIARAFYEEKRGGRDSGTGVNAFVTYGKWYLLFALTPWLVELIDQLGAKMLTELRTSQ